MKGTMTSCAAGGEGAAQHESPDVKTGTCDVYLQLY